MLRVRLGNLDWLRTLLQGVSAKTSQRITFVVEVRRPLTAGTDVASMHDRLQKCLSRQLCTSIDEMFCAVEVQTCATRNETH